jgi:hypothetical protein
MDLKKIDLVNMDLIEIKMMILMKIDLKKKIL